MTASSALGLAFILAFILALLGAVARWRAERTDRPRMLRRAGDGYVLLRQQAIGHHCEPPGADHPATGQRVSGMAHGQWTTGDVWLCGCGRAWRVVVVGSMGIAIDWDRWPADDVAPLDAQ